MEHRVTGHFMNNRWKISVIFYKIEDSTAMEKKLYGGVTGEQLKRHFYGTHLLSTLKNYGCR